MTIKVNGVTLTDKQVEDVIKSAVAIVKDGLEPDPGLEGEMAEALYAAGLIDDDTRGDYVGD